MTPDDIPWGCCWLYDNGRCASAKCTRGAPCTDPFPAHLYPSVRRLSDTPEGRAFLADSAMARSA